MAVWLSYSLEDFVPFTLETWQRLIERHNAAQWPLQVVALAAGLLVLVWVWRRPSALRPAFLLAGAWGWTAWKFLAGPYADLVWAGHWFAWGFTIQAGLILAWGLAAAKAATPPLPRAVAAIGWILAAGGIVLFPLAALVSGSGRADLQVFGIFPDPTVVSTMGLLLLLARGPVLALLLVLPVLWSAVAGATAWAIGASLPLALPLAALATFAAAIGAALAGRFSAPSTSADANRT